MELIGLPVDTWLPIEPMICDGVFFLFHSMSAKKGFMTLSYRCAISQFTGFKLSDLHIGFTALRTLAHRVCLREKLQETSLFAGQKQKTNMVSTYIIDFRRKLWLWIMGCFNAQ